MTAAMGPMSPAAADRLALALADAARARALRSLGELATAAKAQPVYEEAARLKETISFAQALAALERLTGLFEGELDLHLEKFATAQLVASRSIREIRTRIPRLATSPEVGHCITATIREVVHAIETTVAGGFEIAVDIALRLEKRALVMTITSRGRGVQPVPTSSGVRALALAERIAQLSGGAMRRASLRRGMRIALVFGVRTVPSHGTQEG